VEAGECGQVRELAHDIKGTGLGYGFPPLTEAARELEDAAAGGDLEHMRNALRQMEEYVNAVQIEPGA
jgi:HPt (histidine-containing phosphotransfer) domain-containing protein